MDVPSPAQVRAVNAVMEPFHAVLYFAPQIATRLAQLGLDLRTDGYFAVRSAPLGAASPELVSATFVNFNPAAVAALVPKAWATTTPDAVMAARHEGLAAAHAETGALDGIDELSELAGAAAVDLGLAGRPLAAANAAVELPDDPAAACQQRITVLREHRGDGHIAALVTRGMRPIEALVLMAAWPGGGVSRRFLQRSRAWDDESWDAAAADLRAVGLLDAESTLTEDGEAFREAIEHDTDILATEPYARIGVAGTRRMFELLRPLAESIGAVYPRPPRLPDAFPAH